jgi:outer membrane protein assembly factor BamB
MIRQFSFTFIIAVFSFSTLFATDWTAFRGPDGNGKSPDTGLLKKWSPEGPKLLWMADFIGFGWSGVAIADGRIYITGNTERDGKKLHMVFCFDKDGKLIWEKDNGPANADARKYPGTRGTPTIDGNFVYDVSALGEVTCFDAKTGKKIWNRNPVKEYAAPEAYWNLGNAVLIEGDNVIYPLGGPKHIAVALNKKTGETAWEAPPVADPAGAIVGYTTPYAFDFEGVRVVTVMSVATVEGLDAKTGKNLFSIPWTNSHTCHCTMPIYHNGHLFMTTGYNDSAAKLFKLAKNTDGTIATTELWAEPRFNNHHGGVILVGDYVYGTTHNGSWASINFMTGEIGYLVRSRDAGKGSVHYADGLLYGLTEDDRTVLLIKPDPKEFVLLSKFELPNEAEGKSWAHPVVFDDRLYLRHAQYLYCYDVKAE